MGKNRQYARIRKYIEAIGKYSLTLSFKQATHNGKADKITFALYKGEEKCIISQAYETFEIIDKNLLNPDYLMMWALRPEFDRYAHFKSNGSAREIFSWDEMCEVHLPVPDIAAQRKIVAEYQAVENRIATNKRIIAKLEDPPKPSIKRCLQMILTRNICRKGGGWGKCLSYLRDNSSTLMLPDGIVRVNYNIRVLN